MKEVSIEQIILKREVMDGQRYNNVWGKYNRQNTSNIIGIEGQRSSFKMDSCREFRSSQIEKEILTVTGGLKKDSSNIYTF